MTQGLKQKVDLLSKRGGSVLKCMRRKFADSRSTEVLSIRLVAIATIGTRVDSSEMYVLSLSRLIFSARFRMSRLELLKTQL